jgi:hypothetical protein
MSLGHRAEKILAFRCFMWGKQKCTKIFEQKDSKVSKEISFGARSGRDSLEVCATAKQRVTALMSVRRFQSG